MRISYFEAGFVEREESALLSYILVAGLCVPLAVTDLEESEAADILVTLR